MHDHSTLFLTFGCLFALGLLTNLLGQRSPVPRASLLMIAGILLGPWILNFLPQSSDTWFEPISDVALVMIAFLLGEQLTVQSFRESGRVVTVVSITVVVATAVIVFAGLKLAGFPTGIALLLAGIAPATDPAATLDVLKESRARGKFTDALKNIVALDDLWGLLAFSLFLVFAQFSAGQSGVQDIIGHAIRDIGLALVVGLGIGIPAAYLTGRLSQGEPSLVEALALVFICLGLCQKLEVSFLLAAMTMGAAIANLQKHHEYPFREIAGIEWPFMILFFTLAGASLEVNMLSTIGMLGACYVIFRIAGRLAGGWIGGLLSGAEPRIRNWIGAAMMPQAGVAIGMALITLQLYPDEGQTILTTIVASTMLFEIGGPILTRYVIVRVGENALSDQRP